MRRIIDLLTFLVILTAIAPQSFAEEISKPDSIVHPDYRGRYILPHFKENWHFQRYKNWVISNICYPEAAIDNKSEGRVVVAFIIDTDGVVRNAAAIETPDTLLSNELIRVVKSGKWYSPAKEWNSLTEMYEPVKIRSLIPIVFNLPAEQPESHQYDHLTYGMMKSSFSGF